jgi:hypothetical protein
MKRPLTTAELFALTEPFVSQLPTGYTAACPFCITYQMKKVVRLGIDGFVCEDSECRKFISAEESAIFKGMRMVNN